MGCSLMIKYVELELVHDSPPSEILAEHNFKNCIGDVVLYCGKNMLTGKDALC